MTREKLLLEGVSVIVPALRSYRTRKATALADAIEATPESDGERNRLRDARREFITNNPEVPERTLARMLKTANLYAKTTYWNDIVRNIRKVRTQFHKETGQA